MRIPSALAAIAAALLALPLGWGLGVDLAYVMAGPDFGQLPAGTVPLCIVGAIVFALAGPMTAPKRLAVMAAATAVFLGGMMLLPL
jgi:hypothetical protein